MAIDRTKYNAYLENLKAQLIVSLEDITATSQLDLNIDESKLIFACVNAQKLYLEPMIGSALYRKLQSKPLTFEYQLLLDRFANSAIINWGVAEVLQSISISVANGGVYRHTSTDSEVASASDVENVRQNYLSKANVFAQRLLEFLNKNSSYYPEYSENSADGINATKRNLFTGGLNIELSYGLGLCGMGNVGTSDSSIFEAATYWGNSDEGDMMLLDVSTLGNTDNVVPPTIFAQPISNYFWIASSESIKIQQLGIDIPLDDINDADPLTAVYVKGAYNNMYYIRIKLAGTYTTQVQFNVVLV